MFEKTLIILFGVGPLIALPVGLLTPLIYEWMLRLTRFMEITDYTTFNDPFGNAFLAALIATYVVFVIEWFYPSKNDSKRSTN